MDEIKEYKVCFTAPADWSELTKKQLRFVARLSQYTLTRQEILYSCFVHFCNLRIINRNDEFWFKRKGEEFQMNNEILLQLCKTFSYILDKRPTNVVNITKIPSNLHGIKFIDYYKANALFLRYDKEGKMRYFRKGYKALAKRPFFGGRLKAKMVLYWWYSVMEWLKEKYPYVFDGDSVAVEYSPMDNLREILAMVTELHPELNKEILTCDAHEVLLTMNEKIRQFKEIEKMRQ